MSSGDEHERAERAARAAGELLSMALGASAGDLDRALGRVGRDDALAVLGAVLRELAGLSAAQQLRDVDLAGADDDDVVAGEPEPAAVGAHKLPPDPWETGNAGTDAVEHGARLWEAIEAQRDVAGLLQAVGALSRDDLALVVLERGLSALAERHRPSGGGERRGRR